MMAYSHSASSDQAYLLSEPKEAWCNVMAHSGHRHHNLEGSGFQNHQLRAQNGKTLEFHPESESLGVWVGICHFNNARDQLYYMKSRGVTGHDISTRSARVILGTRVAVPQLHNHHKSGQQAFTSWTPSFSLQCSPFLYFPQQGNGMLPLWYGRSPSSGLLSFYHAPESVQLSSDLRRRP